MQTISTKYIGPTNTRGSHIVAKTSEGKSKTISYDYELDAIDSHLKAVKALKKSLGRGWSKQMTCGGTKTGLCCVFSSDRKVK